MNLFLKGANVYLRIISSPLEFPQRTRGGPLTTIREPLLHAGLQEGLYTQGKKCFLHKERAFFSKRFGPFWEQHNEVKEETVLLSGCAVTKYFWLHNENINLASAYMCALHFSGTLKDT